jgi:hypothetical protein
MGIRWNRTAAAGVRNWNLVSMNTTTIGGSGALRVITSAQGPKMPQPDSQACTPRRIFLLSPANAAGVRGKLVLNDRATFSVAARLRRDGVPLGELFSFISGLYFRGKLAYAKTFSRVPEGMPGTLVITAGRGLVPPEQPITRAELQQMLSVPIDASHVGYRKPLERDVRTLAGIAGRHCELVLLGSVATPKYIEPLLAVLGERLLFPREFAGRGDMSRGALMLRCAQAGVQLTYAPVATASRHGPRPPRLPRLVTGA